MVDEAGFRLGVAMVIVDERNRIFWARRFNRHGWQFPQGGLEDGESAREAMYRELHEEVGLAPDHVEIIAESRRWLYYHLPKKMIRHKVKPLVIGQRQKWFLLRVNSREVYFDFSKSEKPEFGGFRWVNYWFPLKQVIFFKKRLYRKALKEFAHYVFPNRAEEILEVDA